MMRLDPECIRDILLLIESLSGYNTGAEIFYSNPVTYFDFYDDAKDGTDSKDEDLAYPIFEKFTPDTVFYHIDYCYEADLIKKPAYQSDYRVQIQDLTPLGHDFLANIREDTNWKKSLSVAKSVGSLSLKTLIDISSRVIAICVSQQFQT